MALTTHLEPGDLIVFHDIQGQATDFFIVLECHIPKTGYADVFNLTDEMYTRLHFPLENSYTNVRVYRDGLSVA